jgi:amino acid adenylation domain-containing protein
MEDSRSYVCPELCSHDDFLTVEKCVHDLFSEQAKLNPDKIAVKINNQWITYFELNKKSDYLAHLLRSECNTLTPRVGLLINRSIDLIVAVIAIMKAGGVCVPLDASYPENRLLFMAKDAGLNYLLTTKNISLYPSLRNIEDNTKILYLDDVNFETINTELNIQESLVSLDQLIYILYTSGSTGNPKGVAMPHRTLSNLIRWHLLNFDIKKGSRTLQFSPISFDVAFQEIFSTLCSGQTLVLVSDDIRQDPCALFELIKNEEISQLFLPAVALQQFAKVAKRHKPLEKLSTIFTAGEQLKITADIEMLFETLPEACLYNHYGPTETHVVTSFRLSKDIIQCPSLPPIGTPILNVKTYILDENLKIVQFGSIGELHIGGDCLAKGYINLPELTKERFIPSPFGDGKLYKTGDLACYQADGCIRFLGRADRQVKIRGFRIELGEVEVALLCNENINECVVVERESEVGHKELLAYIALPSESQVKFDIFKRGDFGYKIAPKKLFLVLQTHLNNTLPNYMLPSLFIIIDKIPLTPSGKVDQTALPIPSVISISSLAEHVKTAKITLVEKITTVWEEILQVRPIENHENFFDLGGNSLLLETLNVVLSKVFDWEIPIIILFNNPSIQTLVTYLEGSNIAKPINENISSRITLLKSQSTKLRANIRKLSNARNNEND